MAETIRVYRQPVPPLRFIGKRYAAFSSEHWDEWFDHGWFDQLEAHMGGLDAIRRIWPDGGGYVGMERCREGEPFAYYIGLFTPPGTPVPEGFLGVDFEKGALGVCWLYGPEDGVHDTRPCRQALEQAGMTVVPHTDGAIWSFENCLCPRYTTPDENGNVILDYCYFVQ
jgi:hypothetical protein